MGGGGTVDSLTIVVDVPRRRQQHTRMAQAMPMKAPTAMSPPQRAIRSIVLIGVMDVEGHAGGAGGGAGGGGTVSAAGCWEGAATSGDAAAGHGSGGGGGGGVAGGVAGGGEGGGGATTMGTTE